MNKNKWILISYIFFGGLIDIPRRYLVTQFDSFTQNSYRFFFGSLSLFIISFIFYRKELKQMFGNKKMWVPLIFMSAIFQFSQYIYTEGLARTSVVIANLVLTMGIPLTIIISSAIYPDEKKQTRGKHFFLGAALAIGGTLGTALSRGDLTVEYSLGIVYLIIASLLIIVALLMIKNFTKQINPICLGSLSSGLMCIFFFIEAFIWGDVTKIARVSSFTNFLLVFSGVQGLLSGIGLGYLCINIYGIIVSNFAMIAMPVIAWIFGYIFFKETLNPMQIFFALVLTSGCYLILKQNMAKKKVKAIAN